MSFKETFDKYEWDEVKHSIYSKSEDDVKKALMQKGKRNVEDFKALISPAAAPFLESMAKLSNTLTRKRFGNTMQLYIPLYLSNECQNICTYCGFSLNNKIKRTTLTDAQILQEAAAIKANGFDHVLVVTGESGQTVGVEYLQKALRLLRPHFSQISMEVQPLETEEYKLLLAEGLHTVLVYQETYHKEDYKIHHPKGRKSNFDYRLETPDRLGEAGLHKIGLGVLIGLEDWRTDSFFSALHLDYLEKTFWKTRYSISFPRLRPFSGGLEPKVTMSDKELVQLICAYRIFREDTEISISTRETQNFRDHVVPLGVTSMSAGSKTNPGGYSLFPESLEQFEVSDERSPSEIANIIKNQGYEPVWKDWDRYIKSE